MRQGGGNEWIKEVCGTSKLVLVGNSARLLQASPPLGSCIDRFDRVIRFSNMKTLAYQSFQGTKTSHMVIGDFQPACGCDAGDCCTPKQITEFWTRVKSSHARNVLILFRNFNFLPILSRSSTPSGIRVVTARFPREAEHFQNGKSLRMALLNRWLDMLATQNSVLTHRVPPKSYVRAGLHTIMLLLLNGCKPYLVGFDTDAGNADLRSSRQFSTQVASPPSTDHERIIVAQLVRAGLVVDLHALKGRCPV
eukprot:jgi/Mesvir1/20576/Mv14817-RA.1